MTALEQATQSSRTALQHLARHQVMGLAAQFLLGTAVGLIGLPSQTSGAAHIATNVFLAAHMLIAAGLAVGAVLVLRGAAGAPRWRHLATWGALAIMATISAGVLTTITHSNWWSYAMAFGFIASLLIYGSLVVQAHDPNRR